MQAISVLPRHNVHSLSPQYPIERLSSHPTPQIFPQAHEISVRDKLVTTYESEAALTQYVLEHTPTGNPLPMLIRLKEASLSCLDPKEISVSMRWVILDWDLPSKGIAWGDPSKPESQEQVAQFLENHTHFKHLYAYYFSKSGVRLIFALSNPLQIKDSIDVEIWKQFYKTFIHNLDVSHIGGELELTCDPFTLNRVPRYTTVDGLQVKGVVIFRNTTKPIRVSYPSREKIERQQQLKEARKKAKPTFTSLPPNEVRERLWNEPLICFLRETGHSLHYQDWRAIGINIAVLLGESEGFAIFDEISKWDANGYDANAVTTQWPHIVNSANEYGPTTWSQFQLDLTKVYDHHNPRSSLAARIRRAIGESNSQGTTTNAAPGLVDNTQDVYDQLLKTAKAKGDAMVHTPNLCPTNLLTILTLDNRWNGVSKIRRNHLGSIDMIGDRRIEDEDIVAIRETISRIYGLKYSKDEVWDMIKYVAHANEFHPVADYLTTLKWDGVDRIADFAKALGQIDPFTHILLRKFLISAIVRPIEWNNYAPSVNWKIDTVLILKGHQGKRKSSFFKALCADEEWFSDNLPSITHERKDASLHMLGKWLVEQAEFEGHVARSSVEMMKAFITREREIFRKAYGRAEINMRRPSVLVGTTNSSSFLNDPTGDRRFWVLEIPKEVTIDLKWVHTNRDQLWAQAVELYRQGEIWWLTEAESAKSNTMNSRFRRPDALREAVLDFVNTAPTMAGLLQDPRYEDDIGFTLKHLVTTGLDKKLADIKTYEAQNITSHLSDLGFVKIRLRINNQRMYVFRKLKDFTDEEVF